MKCEHCGKSVNILSNYCEHCGQPVQPVFKRATASISRICKKHKWILPVFAAVIVLIVAAAMITNYEKTLDFTDYIVVEVSGYDTMGNIEVNLDYDKLAEDILGKEPDKTKKENYEAYVQYMNNKEMLKYLISVESNKYNDLSNGEFFLVTVTVESNEFFENNNISIKEESYTKTYEIGKDTEKLIELTYIDIFEYLEIDFIGENGSGKAEISFNEFEVEIILPDGSKDTLTFSYHTSWWNGNYYEIHSSQSTDEYGIVSVEILPEYDLSNGDLVAVYLNPDTERLAELFGILIYSTGQEYEVSGLTN